MFGFWSEEMKHFLLCLLSSLSILPGNSAAETGYDAWLRCESIDLNRIREHDKAMPACVMALGDCAVIRTAQQELIRSARGTLGRTLRAKTHLRERNHSHYIRFN
jgi:alpha-glucuronidase